MRDPKERSRLVAEHCQIKDEWVKRIFSFAPDGSGPNIVVDSTKGIAYFHEVRESLVDGFQNALSRGPLTGEPIRGLRLEVTDLVLHADARHRMPNQITPLVEKAVQTGIADAEPLIMEPIYAVEFSVLEAAVGDALKALTSSRGSMDTIDSEDTFEKITGTLPVAEADGFQAYLFSKSKDYVLACRFSHYTPVPGQVDDRDSVAGSLVARICEAKGRKPRLSAELRCNSEL